MKNLFPLAVALICASGAFAQQTKILTAEKHNEYGILYSLPTTALKITVTAEKETRTAGPYYGYALKYLGRENVITENSTRWNIKSVKVVPVGVKDNDTQYLIQLKPGAVTFVGVDANGMLRSINEEPNAYKTPEIITSSRTIEIKDDGKVDEYLKYVDMDFISSQSSMKQAEMISSSLMEIRDAYLSLTRGTADNNPTDGKQLELMLNSLRQQEEAMSRAFTGTTSTETVERDYLYIPEGNGEEILFRLSNINGFTDKDDFSGEPVYISTEILYEGHLPQDANGVEKKLPKDAIIYAIPGTARISLSTTNQKIYEVETDFAQFGTTFGLNPTLFTDKKSPSFAVFSPETGALLEIGKVSAQSEE